MNTLQILSLISAAGPLILNFEVLKAAKTAKAKKVALSDMTARVMELVDDFTPLKITDRKKFAANVAGLLETLEIEAK